VIKKSGDPSAHKRFRRGRDLLDHERDEEAIVMRANDIEEAMAERWLETALNALCGMIAADEARPDLSGLADLTGRMIDLPPGAHLEFEIAVRRRRVAFE